MLFFINSIFQMLIIALYGLAISQYKTYRCPRTRRHLVLQMADEYFVSRDFGKALTLYTHMLWDFRAERWWKILSEILQKAIRCAFLTANLQDYILFALEILSAEIELSQAEKKRIHENLMRIFKKQIPYGDPDIAHEILQNAIVVWQPIFANELNLSLEMANTVSCIETKAQFTRNAYEIDQNVTVEVFVKSSCPFPLQFSQINVTINTPTMSSQFSATDSLVKFQRDEVKRFEIEFKPNVEDINQKIQVFY